MRSRPGPETTGVRQRRTPLTRSLRAPAGRYTPLAERTTRACTLARSGQEGVCLWVSLHAVWPDHEYYLPTLTTTVSPNQDGRDGLYVDYSFNVNKTLI